MNSRSTLKRTKREVDQNQVESVEDLRKELVKGVKSEVLEKSVTTAWEQLLGISKSETNQDTGDLREGEELTLSKKERRLEVEPAIDYAGEIIHAQERSAKRENRELTVRVEEIIVELKKISKSSKQIEVAVRDVNLDLLPEAPGKYHLNFFEWLLITLQTVRIRVEESASWASVVSGKRAKKDFWSLARKHGTSYQLSGERVVAQQVG